MSSDPQTRTLLEELAAVEGPKAWEVGTAEMREMFEALFDEHGLPAEDLVDREELEVPGPEGPLRARVYRPRDGGAEPLPGAVYYHGGGMVANSIDTYEGLLQRLAAGSGCAVAACDYRLAPEHRFPAGVEDAFAFAEWTHANAGELGIDPERLAVAGDSAGGYLAAVVTQMARDSGGPPFVFQLLVYPAVGSRGESRSLVENATGYLFERPELDWLYDLYLTDPAQISDPRVSPILQPDLSGLPPAFLLTAELDILRDDGEDYARLLEQAGVPVEVRRYEGMIHPFLNLAGTIERGRDAIEECAEKLRAGVRREAGA